MNFISKLFWPVTAPIKFIQENFKTVLFLTLLYLLFYVNSDTQNIDKANLQTIDLSGPIMSSKKILEKIDEAKENKNIKGVLLNVNSPGGAVAPSVEIAYAIKELNAIKPVVAYANGTMASGSYYASIYASKIIANPGSMIGSIGVIMQSVDASELMSKIGVKSQSVKVGQYKEAGTPIRTWTKKEREELQKITQNTYDMFVSDVAKARGLKKEDHTVYADAHIFTASLAHKVKLVDEVATRTRAKKLVEELSKVDKPIWTKEDKMDKFMEKLTSSAIAQITNNVNGLMAF
ncbi:MAG: signal peptide peptidase SppA [Campylobacterota bacterium]|nr:signal peptide peptidase SppA [Campylobacterota bacterium]